METNMTMKTEISRRLKPAARKLRVASACLALAGLCAIALTPTSASAGTYDFVGRWMNSDQDSSGITGIVITPNRNGLDIHVFGRCRGQSVCDWDVAQGNLYSTGGRNFRGGNWGGSNWGGFNWGGGNWARDTNVVTANVDVGYARKLIVLRSDGGDQLRAEIFTDSRDRFGRPGYVTETELQKWGRMPGGEYNGDRNRGPDRGYQQDHGYQQGNPDQQSPNDPYNN